MRGGEKNHYYPILICRHSSQELENLKNNSQKTFSSSMKPSGSLMGLKKPKTILMIEILTT
jgi:hypothetical protein